LSPDIARRRLPGFSIKELLSGARKVEHLEGRFLYPRLGYGQIADKMAQRLSPGRLLYRHRVVQMETRRDEVIAVGVKAGEELQRVAPEVVINTLPITLLVRMMNPLPPQEVLDAAAKLRFRDVVLVALFIDQESISDAAVTYFQGSGLDFTRAHEPRNRSSAMSPPGQTSLVVEYPCFSGDEVWHRDEKALVDDLIKYLDNMGLVKASRVIASDVHRLQNAYPVYSRDYKETAEIVLSYLRQFRNLWTLGRGGSFFYGHVHDFITDSFSAAEAADAYLHQEARARV
jgi:protoporphyrinogen oxidase